MKNFVAIAKFILYINYDFIKGIFCSILDLALMMCDRICLM